MSRRTKQRGSVMLEGAFCLIAFLLIVFGTAEFGRVMYAYNFVAYAAREGSRWASVRGAASGHPCQAADVTKFLGAQAVGLEPGQLQVITTWAGDNHAPGSTVAVRVIYTVPSLVRFVLPQNLTVVSASQMTILQ